jgi:hypothetical protein
MGVSPFGSSTDKLVVDIFFLYLLSLSFETKLSNFYNKKQHFQIQPAVDRLREAAEEVDVIRRGSFHLLIPKSLRKMFPSDKFNRQTR